MAKKVAIIIITMNKKPLIKRCLYTLRKKSSYKNYNVILLDNGSTDGTVEMIKKDFKWVDFIENKYNMGFARANNVGIKKALRTYNPDYVLLLNDDTEIIQSNWLEKMVELGESDKKIGIIGCRLIYPDGSLQFYAKNHSGILALKGSKLDLNKDDGIIQEINLNIGATFLIKRTLLKKIGLLDPGYFPIYGEEIDYCLRARKNGFKIVYTPYATIMHIGAATINPRKALKSWFIQKKMSIRLELIQYSPLQILYWQGIHLANVFFKKEVGGFRFMRDFYKKLFLLMKAYLENLLELPNIINRRQNIHRKLWY